MSKHYQVRVGKFNVVGFANAADATDFQRRRGGKIETLENGVTVDIQEDSGKGRTTDPGTSDNCPTPAPGLATLLGLPASAAVNSPELVRLAWKANGNKSSPRNSQAIATALVDYFTTKRGLSRDAAEKHVRDTCPLLFKSELAKTVGAASNERQAANEIIHTANEGIYQSLGPFVAA